MSRVELSVGKDGEGSFFINEEDSKVAWMDVAIKGRQMTVFHTEVLEEAEGRGLAKELLAAMVEHARKNELKVYPLCAFVHTQFDRHKENYTDIWQKQDNE